MIHVPIHFFKELIHSMNRFLERYGTFLCSKVVKFVSLKVKKAILLCKMV